MNCDICENKFDESDYKPYVLYPCSHTFCINCLNVWTEKTCPNCRLVIQDKNPNWMLMKLIAEIDKINSNCPKTLKSSDDAKPQMSKSENKTSLSDLIAVSKINNEQISRPPSTIDEPIVKPPIKIDPKSAEVYKTEGLAFISAKKYDEAINCLDKSIQINHNDYVVQNSKGFALNQLGKYEEAILCFDKAIKIYSNYALAYNNKAISLSALSKYELAIECFDKVLELDPEDHKGLYNKGVALFKLQKYDEAIKFFRKSIAIYPNDRQTQLQLDKCISAKKKEIILKNQLSNAFSLI